MIAQLSQSDPRGSASSSSSGVRSAGSFARNSGVPLFPHMSISSHSRPAARMSTRADRLLTLGLRMLSVFAAISPPPSVVDESRLVLAAPEASPWHEVHAGLDDEHGADPLTNRVGECRLPARAARELDGDRQRRLLLDARALRPDEDVAADLRREAADDLAHGRREDVHAAHE